MCAGSGLATGWSRDVWWLCINSYKLKANSASIRTTTEGTEKESKLRNEVLTSLNNNRTSTYKSARDTHEFKRWPQQSRYTKIRKKSSTYSRPTSSETLECLSLLLMRFIIRLHLHKTQTAKEETQSQLHDSKLPKHDDSNQILRAWRKQTQHYMKSSTFLSLRVLRTQAQTCITKITHLGKQTYRQQPYAWISVRILR
jgi:hypothetical protein